MGWFWADNNSKDAKCPVDHSKFKKSTTSSSGAAACPVDHGKFTKDTEKAVCPVKPNDDNILNPLNNMPALSNDMAPGQKIKLSTDRVYSSIPKGENNEEGVWEYPSPQQMLNAMLRKGKGQGIPEDAVESMVEIHNFLNEGAWQQILEWESKYTKETKIEPRLEKFTGRPNDLSPRASMYLYLSKIFPETFNSQPPFDRHDWTVLRSKGRNNGWDKIRYVIDYYSAPDDEETGMPSFVLDTRPAFDNVGNAYDRFVHWSGPLYRKAMGDKET
ncbi:holocytochrome-c synthase [[Candida] jaroonii]|uniref:Holocytochrome-c synthase n=1 Tax=[Candida] jaroonii TaxID=467808 RepID=A0ACA9YE01_9ASCO|nr:holocytochrome-c synthase [[Candida] jaroonii]